MQGRGKIFSGDQFIMDCEYRLNFSMRTITVPKTLLGELQKRLTDGYAWAGTILPVIEIGKPFILHYGSMRLRFKHLDGTGMIEADGPAQMFSDKSRLSPKVDLSQQS
jgi:hypothetical protein